MASVYDILLELPILKGIGRERLSTLLEKTHLDFKTVKAQALMAKTGELCNTVRCVLSGSFEKITGCIGGELTVREEVTAPAIIGLENLFGLDTTYCSDYNAVTECSVMEFPKMQLVSLLSDNEICLINMLNYLSAASQRPFDAWRSRTSSGLAGNLQRLLATAVSSGRGDVFIESDTTDVDLLLCEDGNSRQSDKSELISLGLIDISNPKKWKINCSPREIAERFDAKNHRNLSTE